MLTWVALNGSIYCQLAKTNLMSNLTIGMPASNLAWLMNLAIHVR
jgi:hypothetical protein